MKTLKMFFVLLVVVFFGCQEKILVEPNDAPVADGKIEIQASTLYKTTAGSTSQTEKGIPTTYKIILKDKSLTIVAYQWTFSENGYKSSSPSVDFWHNLDPGAKTTVTVVAVDDKGVSHTSSIEVEIVYSLDGQPGFAFVSSSPLGNNLYSLVFIAHKKAMKGLSGPYGYSGSVVSPAWSVKQIPANDLEFNYVNGVIMQAQTGDVGKFVVIRVVLSPGDYQLPVGCINSEGKLIWGSFWGVFKDNKFTLNNNGNVTAIAQAIVPGESGDDAGNNTVIRKDLRDSTITIYTKHLSPFSNGYTEIQDSSGRWLDPIPQNAVSDYPNWGKTEIKFKNLPMPGVIFLRFGQYVNGSKVLATNMTASPSWDDIFKYLKIKAMVVLGKKSG